MAGGRIGFGMAQKAWSSTIWTAAQLILLVLAILAVFGNEVWAAPQVEHVFIISIDCGKPVTSAFTQ